jgi:hypothetical protein
VGADRQADVPLHQVAQHGAERAQLVELLEDQAHDRLHLLVGVDRQPARGQAHVAHRRVVEQLPPPRLVQPPLVHPLAEHVQLGLADRPLEAEQQAVVVIARIVQAIGVGQQRVEQGAQLQELVPVLARAGQAAHLDAEHDADVPEAHLGQQALEARAALGGGAAAAQVLVDHQHPIRRPAPLDRARAQGVLQRRRLAVLEDLLGGRLAHVDRRQPLEVTGLHLGRRRRRRRRRRGRRENRFPSRFNGVHAAPPLPARGAGVGGAGATAGPPPG